MRTRTGYRKLCKRYDEPGHAHYLTFSCFRNQPFLEGDRARQWFVSALAEAKRKHPFCLWAWVIMPEHVHLLIYPREAVRISEILSATKTPVAKTAAGWVRREAPQFVPRMLDIQPSGRRFIRFWQRGGGYDRNIWSVQEVHEKIKYIHNNPVRRELVAAPGDWTWSSFRAWEHSIDDPIPIDRDTLPLMKDV